MASQKVLVKNFYRAILSSAYVAGAAAVGGPPAAAAAAAALASPVGVASIELAAQQATEFTVGSKAMAEGGLITEPTFALLGEAGPEMVIPLKKKPRSRKQRTQDKKKSRAWREANDKLRNKNGNLKKGITQADVAKRAHRILKKL
jgi:SLT domain-containing protein